MKKVKVIAAGDTSLVLDGALLMYRSARGDVYATTHQIDIDASNPARRVIGAGRPLSKNSLVDFARAVDAATAHAGFIPENLLYASPRVFAWWAPAAVRMTWFKSEHESILSRRGMAAHPAVVFVVAPGAWYVFALRESARPTPDTKLYHSPHFNVSAGGVICTGNVSLPQGPDVGAIPAYEDAFFRSHFTHPNHLKAVKYRGGMNKLWHDQLFAPDPDAMTRALLPAKETLQSAIDRIAGHQRNNH